MHGREHMPLTLGRTASAGGGGGGSCGMGVLARTVMGEMRFLGKVVAAVGSTSSCLAWIKQSDTCLSSCPRS